jgi:catechol 2,3-dioxygenase-like lactoylglutathione lyase family enzyme
MIHVADIERSTRFYELLGLKTIDTDRCDPLGWARLHGEGGSVMFLRAEHDFDASGAPFLLCLYTPDLPALRDHLLANGIEAPPIARPDYMPSGELRLKDPDGYSVCVAHWGDSEHEQWLKRIEGRE